MVMNARRGVVHDEHRISLAQTRRELILRQLDSNDAHFINMCIQDPCIIAFVFLNCHFSQAANDKLLRHQDSESKSYLDMYDFKSYGYEQAVTELIDTYLLAVVRTPPEHNNKYKKRQGATATKKLERLESVGETLNSKEATLFRALAAGCNYLASDRADIAYSSKELCREFAVPNVRSYAKLKRLVRHLAGSWRLTHHLNFQTKPSGIKVFVDTDFAGCKATRRSPW